MPKTLPMLLIVFSSRPVVVAIAALIIAPVAIGIIVFRRRRQTRQQLHRLKSLWGHKHARERDFVSVSEFHQVCPVSAGDARNLVDDQTWNDLNMDSIYAWIDRTFTTAGECMLYRILRTPIISADALARRSEWIRLFQDDPTIRQTLQVDLLSVGRFNARGLISLVWTDLPPMHPHAWTYRVLTALALAALVAAATIGGPISALAILSMFLVNMLVHYRTKSRLMGRLAALRQLGGMINAGNRIAKKGHSRLSAYTEPLRSASDATRSIARKVSLLTPEGSSAGDLIATLIEYVSIYLLHEVRTFHAAMTDISAHRDELRTLFRLVGELDAWQSVASVRAGLASYAEPSFTDSGPRLVIRDARHPLLADPVPNSIVIQGAGIAITGSNMSGKTTFLRTVGVNAILAQTINTCLAAEYRARMMRIIASLNESDDLIEGKSYYLAEAERLLKIVRESESEGLALALIDEPLAGTNSPERLAASREILRYLADHNGLVMVSTHDVELVSQLREQALYEAYHFSDLADGQGIRFDYRLRPGLDYHGNALKVLKHLGYPHSIIENAQRDMPASAAPLGR